MLKFQVYILVSLCYGDVFSLFLSLFSRANTDFLLKPTALYNTMLSYYPWPRIYQSQAAQNKWHLSFASQCSFPILQEHCLLFLWASTAMTSFVQGWSSFQSLFCPCHWWCDFSYFKLKPRQLIIKRGFAAFLFLVHIEWHKSCCVQLIAICSFP